MPRNNVQNFFMPLWTFSYPLGDDYSATGTIVADLAGRPAVIGPEGVFISDTNDNRGDPDVDELPLYWCNHTV